MFLNLFAGFAIYGLVRHIFIFEHTSSLTIWKAVAQNNLSIVLCDIEYFLNQEVFVYIAFIFV